MEYNWHILSIIIICKDQFTAVITGVEKAKIKD